MGTLPVPIGRGVCAHTRLCECTHTCSGWGLGGGSIVVLGQLREGGDNGAAVLPCTLHTSCPLLSAHTLSGILRGGALCIELESGGGRREKTSDPLLEEKGTG